MSRIRRTTAGRGRVCLTLTATSALVIGLAWVTALATSPAVKLAAATQPVDNTRPGTASPGRTAGFVLDHGRYLPVAPPRGPGNLVASPLGPVGINDRGQIAGVGSTAEDLASLPGADIDALRTQPAWLVSRVPSLPA